MTSENARVKVHYKTQEVEGLKIFYREAGSEDKPALLVLHGFPTSSNMFRGIIARLGGHFHVVAPDYPGYGFSDAPTTQEFAYTFDGLSRLMLGFVNALGLGKVIVYLMGYGAPIGLRLALHSHNRLLA